MITTDAELLLAEHHVIGVLAGGAIARGDWDSAEHHKAEMRTIADTIRARLAQDERLRADLEDARNALALVCEALGADHVLGIEAGAVNAARETAQKLRDAYDACEATQHALERACARLLDAPTADRTGGR